MAGSIVVTSSALTRGGINKYSIAWTSDASGNVTVNTFSVRPGELAQVLYIPNGGGTAPTDLYDVTMLDPNGYDVLCGTGANLSATVTTNVVPALNTYFRFTLEGGLLIPTVANAGITKGGTIVLYVR